LEEIKVMENSKNDKLLCKRVPASVKRDLDETVLVPDRRLEEYQISSRSWKVQIKLEKLFLDRIETE
jgi:hypothetical protein